MSVNLVLCSILLLNVNVDVKYRCCFTGYDLDHRFGGNTYKMVVIVELLNCSLIFIIHIIQENLVFIGYI